MVAREFRVCLGFEGEIDQCRCESNQGHQQSQVLQVAIVGQD